MSRLSTFRQIKYSLANMLQEDTVATYLPTQMSCDDTSRKSPEKAP